MKNRSKILLALLIVLTLMVGMFAITASAADSNEKTIYLAPGPWEQSGAWYAAWTWGGSSADAWVIFEDTDGDGVYEATMPADRTGMKLNRMASGATEPSWTQGNNGYWNQTGDVTLPKNGNDLITITGWSASSYKFSKFTFVPMTLTVAGVDTLCGSSWNVSDTANDMTYTGANGIYEKVYENVKAGSYELKVAKDHSWNTAWPGSNYSFSVTVPASTVRVVFDGVSKTVSVEVSAPTAVIGNVGYATLQEAVDAAVDGDEIVVYSDINEDVTVARAADVDVTINGNGKTFNGTITVDGKSATFTTGSLTIKNFNFNATGISKDASINFGGNNSMRYVTNVTIENCTFTGADQAKVAIKSYTGGDYNITLSGCTVDNTMHSLMQVTNVTGLEIDGCEVNSKNGIGINSSSDVVIKNSTVNVSGYAVRAGAGSGGTSGAIELTNNTLSSSATDEGVIVIRGAAQSVIDLDMSENVVKGAIHIEGTTAETDVSAEANYWNGASAPVVSGTAVKVLTVYNDEAKTDLAIVSLLGEGTEADPFLINNLDELKWFRDQVNAGNNYSNKFIKVTAAEIDLAGEEWTPIGYMGAAFVGSFDGNGVVIKNLVITKTLTNSSANNGVGFFGRTNSPAVIKNITIENVDITGSLYVGAIVGYGYTGNSVENCTVKGDITIDAWWYAGVIGGNGYMSLVNNCHVIGNDGSYIKGNDGSYIGGIWGFRGEGGQKITNCSVTNLDISGVDRVGGICGIGHYGNVISGCDAADVTVTATDPNATTIGLIVGACQGTESNPTVFSDNDITGITAQIDNGDGTFTPVVEAFGTNINGSTSYSNYYARIGTTYYDSLAAAFSAAVSGDEIVIVRPGTYSFGFSGKSVTVSANVDGVIFQMPNSNYGLNGASMTFNNITFNWPTTGWPYHGLAHSTNMVYNNCTIIGTVWLYGNSEIFNECTFTVTGDAYNVWTYSAKYVEFNKCVFNSDGKSVLVYTEGASHTIDLKITETTFNATNSVAGKAAIEIDTSLTSGANITIDAATTANGFDAGSVSGNSLWNNKKGNAEEKNNDITISIDGEDVLAPLPYCAIVANVRYTDIYSAIAAVKNGGTVTLLSDVVAANSIVVDGKTITLDLDGYTLSFAGVTTFALTGGDAVLEATNSALVKIVGNGDIIANAAGVAFYENGGIIELYEGAVHGVDSITDILPAGYRAVELTDDLGNVYFVVATVDEQAYIGDNGNWFVGEYDTGVAAQPNVEEIDGYWYVNGVNTGIEAGVDGETPEVAIVDGYWFIDGENSGVPAAGVDGFSILNITLSATDGNIDTYTVTYSNGVDTKTSVFFIVNGVDGNEGLQGEPGAEGNKGPQGDRGEPGENGIDNSWFVNNALLIALIAILVSSGVVLALNYKRLNWWSK